MKAFWSYFFPAFFGLVIYTSIRLVNDTMSEEQFWDRSVRQNMIEIIFSILMAYIFVAMLRYFINQFNKRQEHFRLQNVLREFGTVCIACIALVNPFLYLIHYLINDPVDWADLANANIIVVLYALLYYAIVRGNDLVRSYIGQQTQIERLKSAGLQSELKFLKAQYHPHFLFNALNTIYFQMDENVAAAKQTVEKFSELLRYQLYDQQQLVPVQQELQHLQNFIHLQKARASDQLQLTLKIDSALNNEKLYPLLLLPLVENAFKYVGGDYQLSIEARKEGAWLWFEVQNSVPAQSPQKSSGIGLENLKRRLQLLYPGKHQLVTRKEHKHYFAELKLQYA